MIKGIR